MTNDYIRKEDVVDAFNRAVQDVGILDADDIETVFGMLSSADVVPVVRCRDCRKCIYDSLFDQLWCNMTPVTRRVKPDDFCSYGERREE